ncbi:MAG: signal recognition particle-docking protein FtsY [Propionibacteriaceae bacterium]|nr:signal recognition particle-docking protein FtsY [Propionibacteriaceae bacterium]
MDTIFWIIAGLIVAALAAASLIVIIGGRRRKALPGAPAGQLEAADQAEPAESIEPADQGPIRSPQAAADQAVVSVTVVPAVAAPTETRESPEAPLSRWARLRRRLAASDNALARGLADWLSADRLGDQAWEDFETTLITSDLGLGPTTELIDKLRRRLSLDAVDDPILAKAVLRQELIDLVDPELDRDLKLDPATKPGVVLVVGVNGTGKTTTIGKLARLLVAQGQSVLLGAGDTFRAAAADQLQTWGDRIGVATVRGSEQADPASVAFDAARRAQADDIDVLLVDTAGRLHTKVGLMDELGKVKRVIEKVTPVDETLLVLDATTGQNGLVQARVFAQAVQVTGLVLTKLDGSAKGGIVVAVQRELGVPVKFVGLGEGADDLAAFDVEQFVDGLLGQ